MDVPWSGNPSADMACPKRTDDNGDENVWKKGGKATVTAKVSVSGRRIVRGREDE